MQRDINISEQIKKAISNIAKVQGNDKIQSVEDMIPHMSTVMSKDEFPKKKILDLKYGESDGAKMDIYYPEDKEGPYPVFMEVHGGAWFFGQKSSIEFKPFLYGLKKGFVCVSLGYTLSPDGIYPQPVLEIKKAIAYIKNHARELNINPDEITLWGGSAGAHLSALAVFSECSGYLRCEDETDCTVKNLILWYGCYNYYLGKKLEPWMYHNFFGTDDIDKVTEKVLLSNPGVHITNERNNLPRVLLQHGKNDGLVSYEQSVYLYDILRHYLSEEDCVLELLEGCDHADGKMFGEENIKHIFEFII